MNVHVITGASDGIGAEMARQLAASQGKEAALVLAARSEDKLNAVAAQCEALHAQTLVVPMDVSDEAQCRSLIETAVPPPELGLGPESLLRVSVFMSVFNCHVNRMPIAGKIAAIAYRPGKFVSASLDKASSDNERNSLAIEMADGRKLVVVQIAGLVARRIVCWGRVGQSLRTGDRFGLIRFGSRLDVYLPAGVAPLVALGQTMIAGETVLADLTGTGPARLSRAE